MLMLRLPMASRMFATAVALALAPSVTDLRAQTAHSSASPGLDVAGMDRSVKPGNDFFDYANGTWVKETEIPADRSSYGAGAILDELTSRQVADLIQTAAQTSSP